ncbi:MAG: hypothetical protein LBU27_05685 [Candidatus Peribacteria bacterium]|nr:hypothetical protein [Candidatus Peribacteria bacterium]
MKLLLAQKKQIIISCYDPKWLSAFFSQFIDIQQIVFIHEIPKGPRSAFQWLKKGGLKELMYFRTTDTVILGGGEILTEESRTSYRYRLVSMRPFLLARCFRKVGKKGFLYVM